MKLQQICVKLLYTAYQWHTKHLHIGGTVTVYSLHSIFQFMSLNLEVHNAIIILLIIILIIQ